MTLFRGDGHELSGSSWAEVTIVKAPRAGRRRRGKTKAERTDEHLPDQQKSDQELSLNPVFPCHDARIPFNPLRDSHGACSSLVQRYNRYPADIQ